MRRRAAEAASPPPPPPPLALPMVGEEEEEDEEEEGEGRGRMRGIRGAGRNTLFSDPSPGEKFSSGKYFEAMGRDGGMRLIGVEARLVQLLAEVEVVVVEEEVGA